MIKWFAENHVAANLLMFAIMIMGYLSVKNDIPLELMPDFQLGQISIVTILPGGNPKSIEETITTRIEEAVADLQGIKKITSRSSLAIRSSISTAKHAKWCRALAASKVMIGCCSPQALIHL